MTKPAFAERRDRILPVVDSMQEAKDTAAVVFMTNWMKRKGVTLEDVLALGVWTDVEKQSITKIYKYGY